MKIPKELLQECYEISVKLTKLYADELDKQLKNHLDDKESPLYFTTAPPVILGQFLAYSIDMIHRLHTNSNIKYTNYELILDYVYDITNDILEKMNKDQNAPMPGTIQ